MLNRHTVEYSSITTLHTLSQQREPYLKSSLGEQSLLQAPGREQREGSKDDRHVGNVYPKETLRSAHLRASATTTAGPCLLPDPNNVVYIADK